VTAWACTLAILLAVPCWSQDAPINVQSLPIRELGKVTESPPVMGVIWPTDEQAQDASVKAQGKREEQAQGATLPAQRRLAEKYDVAKIGDRHVGRGFDLYSL